MDYYSLNNKGTEKCEFVKNYLYLSAFVLWFLWKHLLTTTVWESFGWSAEAIDAYVKLIFVAIFFGIIVLLRKYTKKQIFIILIVTALIALSGYYYDILFPWMIIVAAKGESFDRMIRWGYLSLCILVGIVILLCLTGVITDYSSVSSRGMIRHSLGFNHPNTLGLAILGSMAYRFYLHRDHWNIWDYLLSILEIAFVYFVPNSQSSCIGMLLLILFSLLWKLARKWERVENIYLWLLVAFCLFCNAFCVITSLLYTPDSPILETLNQFFTTRLQSANTIYQIYGIRFFGNRIPDCGTLVDFNGQTVWLPYLDSSYMNLLVYYGIVIFVIHTYLYLATANWARKKDPVLLIMLAVFAAHGVMEISIIEPYYNLFLLAISLLLFSEDGSSKESEFTIAQIIFRKAGGKSIPLDKKLKICLVGSSGGHLTHLYMLKLFWEKYDRFWVTFDKEDARSLLKGEKLYPVHFPSNRSLKAFIINTHRALRILSKERPDVIISSGAAPAVPFFWLGKLFGVKTVYVEVFDRIDSSTIAGKLCYPVSDVFIVQWEEMKKVYPKAINLGSIF